MGTSERQMFTIHIKLNLSDRKQCLTNHQLTHSGEKTYACDVCVKSFSQSSRLNNYLSTHTGDKLYSCDVCEKSFDKSSSLTKKADIFSKLTQGRLWENSII